MLIHLKKTLFLAVSGLLAFTACGDDGDGHDNHTVDASVGTDANVNTPDAMPDTSFSGTISLAEVAITNPAAALAGGISGAVINMSFTDPKDVTVAPQPGYVNNIGECRIFVYDVANGESAPKGSDGGPVSVTGTSANAFACAYQSALDKYLCSSADSAASGVLPTGATATPNVNGTVTLTIPGADFSSADYVGMYINIAGFNEVGANGSFPIVAQPAATTLVFVNPGMSNSDIIEATAGSYQTFVGAGPIPAGGYDFLDDGSTDIVIAKADATNAPAIAATIKAHGEGFTLADGSVLPHQLPTDGTAVTFSCESADNGDCGTGGAGVLKGIITFGETTDADISGLAASQFNVMPDPVSKYATWQCSGIGAEKIVLDAGAMALIMGTNPTRIQTSITYGNAQIIGKANVIVSHGVVGWTDVTPAQ